MSTIQPTSRPVSLPAAPVRATVVAPTSLPQFKTIDAYESFVRSSDLKQLPAARAAVLADQQAVDTASQALVERKRAVNYDGLGSAKANAEAQLDEANHPMRPQARRIQAEVPALSNRSADLASQVSRLQVQISNIQVNRTVAVNGDAWVKGDGTPNGDLIGGLADIALKGAAYAADGATIRRLQGQIGSLLAEKARVDADVITKTTTAATLENQPGDAETVRPFREKAAAAGKAFDEATTAIRPQAEALDAAQGLLRADTATRDGLELEKTALKDYDRSFGGMTRTSLWFKDHSWKQGLDKFWQGSGL